MRILGIAVIVAWGSLGYLLYPFPPQLIKSHESYLYEQTDMYLPTLSANERQKFNADKDKFLQKKLTQAQLGIWIKWASKLLLIALGILAGYWVYIGRSFRFLVMGTSIVYLAIWIIDLVGKLPAWNLPWLEAYFEFLSRGEAVAQGSLLFQILFYHQFLLFPIVHIALLILCIVWKSNRGKIIPLDRPSVDE